MSKCNRGKSIELKVKEGQQIQSRNTQGYEWEGKARKRKKEDTKQLEQDHRSRILLGIVIWRILLYEKAPLYHGIYLIFSMQDPASCLSLFPPLPIYLNLFIICYFF